MQFRKQWRNQRADRRLQRQLKRLHTQVLQLEQTHQHLQAAQEHAQLLAEHIRSSLVTATGLTAINVEGKQAYIISLSGTAADDGALN